MHIANLEVGLRRAMVAVFRKKGLSSQDADLKATANMQAADTLFHQKHAAGKPNVSSSEADNAEYAMREVVRWAHSL